MKRRDVIMLVGGAAAWPFVARGEQLGRIRRIGVLMGWAESDPASKSLVTTFRDVLSKLGWTEGKNLETNVRWGNGNPARIEAFAKELVELRPDAILGQTTPVVRALVKNTREIPVVFVQVSDPVGSRFVASLAQPGGNITGFATDNSTQGGKWVELLKEIAPRTQHMSVVFNTETAAPSKYFMPSIQARASSLAVQVSAAPVHNKDEFESVLSRVAANSGGGLIITPDPFNVSNRDLIIRLAAQHRVPAIYFNRFFADAGGLIVYGSPFAEFYRQAAEYVGRILEGAKPSELPVQAPTRYELIINLKTAKALGLTVAPTLLASADEVLE